MKKSGVSIEECCNLLSTIVIKNDCETIKAITPMMNQPIVSLNLLPYCALFCWSIKEYLSLESLNNESDFNISDIRNKLKLFDDRYGREKKKILLIDDIQNENFESKLRFDFLKKFDLHYNIGIYLSADHHIIGNTQQINYMFQDRRISRRKMNKEQIKSLGKAVGSIINSVSLGLCEFPVEIHCGLSLQEIKTKYKDFNTNKNFDTFHELDNGKELTLRVLHILSSLNFMRHVIGEIVPNTNMWAMRIKYITMYYASKSIERFIDKLSIEQAEYFRNRNEKLLNSKYRSCMMHYSFLNKGVCAIKYEFLDISTPFWGLVESCFDGISYKELMERIDDEIDYLAEGLESVLKIDLSGSKDL